MFCIEDPFTFWTVAWSAALFSTIIGIIYSVVRQFARRALHLIRVPQEYVIAFWAILLPVDVFYALGWHGARLFEWCGSRIRRFLEEVG